MKSLTLNIALSLLCIADSFLLGYAAGLNSRYAIDNGGGNFTIVDTFKEMNAANSPQQQSSSGANGGANTGPAANSASKHPDGQ